MLLTGVCVDQVQRTVQEEDPGVGGQAVQHDGHPGELAHCAEPLGLPRGCLCRRRHCQAAASGWH